MSQDEMEKAPERVTLVSPAIALQQRVLASGVLGFGSLALFLLPLAIMMVGGGVFGMLKPDWWGPFLSTSWVTALFAGIGALALRGREAARPGSITFAPGELVVERGSDVEVLLGRDLAAATVAPLSGGTRLSVELKDGRTVVATVPSVEAADRALGVLGLDASSRRMRSALRGGLARVGLGALGAFALFLLGGALKSAFPLDAFTGGVWLACAVLATAAWLLGTRVPEVVVGSDGVRLRGALVPRFLPWSALAAAAMDGRTLVLTRRDGTEERLRVPVGSESEMEAIGFRIRQGLAAAHGGGGQREAALAALERRDRSVAAWAEHVARAARGEAAYRTVSLAPTELEALLTMPGARLEHRLGAALALRAEAAEDAAPRIRLAAEQCANPRVRIALERIADGSGEDAAVEEALAEEAMDCERGERAAPATRRRSGDSPD